MSPPRVPARRVRTVLGDIDPADLGATDCHEHLFQRSPLLAGDELDDEAASSTEAQLLQASGCRAYVEATPIGLGRHPEAVARIALNRGLHAVHVTGAHREAHYAPDHPLLASSTENLRARLRAELLTGIRDDAGRAALSPHGRPVRAGVLKVAIDYWRIGPFAERVIEAAAAVCSELDAPVMVHLEHGSAAHEILDRFEDLGCALDRVVLAHVDRNPDPGLHNELSARGAILGFDGPARHREWPDSTILDCISQVVSGGSGDRIVLGGDVARRTRYLAYGGMPGLSYLFDRFVPRLRDRIGHRATERILVDTPARWLAWALTDPDREEH